MSKSVIIFGNVERTSLAKLYFTNDSEHEVAALTVDDQYQKDESFEVDLYKIYFSGGNDKNQFQIEYALIDIAASEKVIEYHCDPVLKRVRLGNFDDNGVLSFCVLKVRDELLMRTIGFKPGGMARMDLSGGLSLSKDQGKSFKRWSDATIIGANKVNPLINTAPWVINEGYCFRMYPVLGIEWLNIDLPRYNMQIATSEDAKE